MSYNQLPTRTKRELQNALTHIAYEVEALRRAAVGKGPGKWLRIEAGLLHVRNLTEFFWTPSTSHTKPHPDGVYATHYIDTKKWIALRSSLSQRPNQKYSAICTQLSHISTARSKRAGTVNFSEKEIARLASDLESIWNVFTSEMASTRWASTLQRAIRRWAKA
jgi:hypothetical protein